LINSRRLFSNAAVSVVQTVISGVVLFVLYRYLIDHLGPEQLGLWSVILASTSVARLSDLGLTGSVVKFVARYHALKDDAQAADVVQTAAISIGLVMAMLVLLLYPLLDSVLLLSIPAQSMPQALSILPWAVFSLWLGSVGGVFQSGLDGCQRMDLRNILMVAGNLLFLGAAIWLVPQYGLTGLALGQAAQGVLLMLTSWLVLRQQLNTLPWIPRRWSKSKFKEMFAYAVNFQISSIAILLFDPATKLLMSRFGGLSSAAYYEMASQLVLKLRSLIVAACQAMVPAVSGLHETSPENVREFYLKSYRLLFFAVLPFFAGIVVALPLVSILWIGHIEAQFLLFATILSVGWGLNTLTGPAYFLNLGTGDLRWNAIAHVVMAIVNVSLGLLLGSMIGGLGVAIGAIVALILGSWFVIHAVHRQYKISYLNMIPAEHYLITFVVLASALIIVLINMYIQNNSVITASSSLMLTSVYVALVGAVLWFHQYRILIYMKLWK